MDIRIDLSKEYIHSPDILRSVEPDNDRNIVFEYGPESYVLNLKNVKLGSISSLCMDLLESVEISRKMWEERI